MRAVFQPPASIVSVVLAPAAVNSLASPTRPEWAVTPSIPADLAAAAKRRPMDWPFNPTAEVERARRIVSQGTSAERQRAVYEAAGAAGNSDQALRAVVRELAAETVSGLA